MELLDRPQVPQHPGMIKVSPQSSNRLSLVEVIAIMHHQRRFLVVV